MKLGFRIGGIAGGSLGLGVSLGMDWLLGEGIGGSWRDAVAHDLERLAGSPYPTDSVAVTAGVAIVLGLVTLLGALVGGVAGSAVGRFVAFLDKD